MPDEITSSWSLYLHCCGAAVPAFSVDRNNTCLDISGRPGSGVMVSIFYNRGDGRLLAAELRAAADELSLIPVPAESEVDDG